MSDELLEFIRESNGIEGILREPTTIEAEAHRKVLALPRLIGSAVEEFVEMITATPGKFDGARLREKKGMNVRVGSHVPPPGGHGVHTLFYSLLDAIEGGYLTPYEGHLKYESLHPFTDGNGRSGRVIWAWHMQRDGQDPFALSFLHRFYYQTLDAQADRQPTTEGVGS